MWEWQVGYFGAGEGTSWENGWVLMAELLSVWARERGLDKNRAGNPNMQWVHLENIR